MSRTPSRWLWFYLWQWAFGTLLVCWLILTGMAYYTGLHEADEINDGQLLSTSRLLLQQWDAGAIAIQPRAVQSDGKSARRGSYAPEVRVVLWHGGQPEWDSHGMANALQALVEPGYHQWTEASGSQLRQWRVLVSRHIRPGQAEVRLAVLVETSRRKSLGRDIAEHIVRPALVLLPVLALLLVWAIRRGLKPLRELSRQTAELDTAAGETLPGDQKYREFDTTVHAINSLVGRLQTQVRRERQFASDVAHELRTPLAALVWQARAAGAAAAPPERQQALDQLEQDALRAGRILAQLLDLARAQGMESLQRERVDLVALAAKVVADHAQQAHDCGHDLGLQAPAQPLHVVGSAMMLELAVRNLVDNALQHTPTGTHVEVRLERLPDGACLLAVCDDGGSRGVEAPAVVNAPGLGIGLTLVQRIADMHGAVFQRTSAAPAWCSCYALTWPSTV